MTMIDVLLIIVLFVIAWVVITAVMAGAPSNKELERFAREIFILAEREEREERRRKRREHRAKLRKRFQIKRRLQNES